MAADGLLAELRLADVRLWIEGGRVAFDAPVGVMTEDLLGRLRSHREELFAVLSGHAVAVAEASDVADELPEGWQVTAGGGCALPEFADLDSECINPDEVPECPKCGWLCDVLLLSGAWRCSRCDPDSQVRRRRTLRVIGTALRITQQKSVRRPRRA